MRCEYLLTSNVFVMEARVSSAASTITKRKRGQLLAHLARQTLSLQLAASLKPRVSAKQGTREQLEKFVHSAVSANTKQELDHILARIAR